MSPEKVMYAVGGIGGDLIEKYAETSPALKLIKAERKKDAVKRLRIWTAAAACIALCAAVFGAVKLLHKQDNGNKEAPHLPAEFAFLADTEAPKDAVLPPEPQGKYNAQYDRLYSIREDYALHEIAAMVTVGDWLYEDRTASYFEAKVEKVYKGELPETITLAMIGNSQSVEEGFVLFSAGEKLLIFSRKWGMPGHEDRNEYEVGSLTAMFIVPDENGNIWLADIKGFIGMQTGKDTECASVKNRAGEMSDVIKKYLSNFDPAFETMNIPFVCSLEDAINVFSD